MESIVFNNDQKMALLCVHRTCGHIARYGTLSAIFCPIFKTTDLEPLFLEKGMEYIQIHITFFLESHKFFWPFFQVKQKIPWLKKRRCIIEEKRYMILYAAACQKPHMEISASHFDIKAHENRVVNPEIVLKFSIKVVLF